MLLFAILVLVTMSVTEAVAAMGSTNKGGSGDNFLLKIQELNRQVKGKLTVSAGIIQEGWLALHANEPSVDPFRTYSSKSSSSLLPWWRGSMDYSFYPVANMRIGQTPRWILPLAH
jgi:hypothetical protein